MKSLIANHKSQITKGYPALTRILFFASLVYLLSGSKMAVFYPLSRQIPCARPSPSSLPHTSILSAFLHQGDCLLCTQLTPPSSLLTPPLGPQIPPHPLSCSQGPGSHHSPNSARLFLPASKHSVICPMKNKIKTPWMTPEYFSNSPPVSLLLFKAKYFEGSGYNH